jgi:3-oxoadipate enol-lactonase
MNATINDQTIHYVESGHGIPVVFIHGFPFSHRMWEPQLLALPDYFRKIAYDVRGHGESYIGDGQYSIEFFVDDLIALLDHLGIEKAVVCGLSMGGYIALRAIERQPGRFLALVLCDTRSAADNNEAKIQRAQSVLDVRRNGVAQYADEFAKKVFAPATVQKNPSVVEMIRDVISLNPPRGIAGTLLALAARTDTTEALSGITVRTMILVGEHDELTPPSDARAMEQKITNVELHVIPEAGHLSNLENPTVFNEKLLAFLHSIRQEVLNDTAG